MADSVSIAEETPVLNPVQRVVDTFVAPSKTFADVRRSSGWWVPFLIAAVVGVLYGYILLHKVGIPALVDGMVQQSTKLQDQLASATPEQATLIRTRMGAAYKYFYMGPVIGLIAGLISAGILLATANFGAGGRATYKQMLGVWFYGTLPLVVFYLVVIAAIYGGVTGDTFNIKNPVGTNIGFYLGSEAPKLLVPLLSAFDIFAIWTAVLLTIGVSTVAGIKRGAAAAVVIGWWIVFILFQTAGAAFS